MMECSHDPREVARIVEQKTSALRAEVERLTRERDEARALLDAEVDEPTPEGLDEMVDRFLAWPLPKSVAADPCATDAQYPHPRSGTNLLTATEAKEMLGHVADGLLRRVRELEQVLLAKSRVAEPTEEIGHVVSWAVINTIREIRGDASDRELIDRLCEVQGYLRNGTKVAEPTEAQVWSEETERASVIGKMLEGQRKRIAELEARPTPEQVKEACANESVRVLKKQLKPGRHNRAGCDGITEIMRANIAALDLSSLRGGQPRTDSYDWRKGGLCHGPCTGHCGFGHLGGCDAVVQWLRENPPSEWESEPRTEPTPEQVAEAVKAMEQMLVSLQRLADYYEEAESETADPGVFIDRRLLLKSWGEALAGLKGGK